MEHTTQQSSRLVFTPTLDEKDELEEKLERCYATFQSSITGSSEKEIHDSLSNAICKEKLHEEICLGLLVRILTDASEASKCYRDLTLLARDGLAIIVNNLNQIILEKYLKLNDVARNQLIWLLREMIRTNVNSTDNVCLNLLRHAAGGDTSHRNLFLIDSLLDIFQENRSWLDRYPYLIASVVYTYLRLIEDHRASHLVTLRQREVLFVVSLIREKINDCLIIGRDLVRLLQNVARIPEIESLWKDLLQNPKSLHSNFSGVLQLLQTRTSRRFLQSRLTPDMERKLVFLTSQVRFGNHKRYQEWFQKQYLATPESQSLRCDLIRFIVAVIHPTNELLCSDIIPRWAVIGWLFTTCTLPVAASNAKLALFYDWLFYDPEKDNIMNIEPAILVMQNSMRSHPAVTATLLDFLCRIIPNFHPPLQDKVKSGIFSSLHHILQKRVLSSLYPLFDSPKLDRELRCQIRETFDEFCLPPNSETAKIEDLRDNCDDMPFSNLSDSLRDNHSIRIMEPMFSDEEDDPIAKSVAVTELYGSEDKISTVMEYKKNLRKSNFFDEPALSPLSISTELEEMKNFLEILHTETDNEMRCRIMEKIVQIILEDEIDAENITILTSCLSKTLEMQINHDIFPNNPNDETFLDSISTPLFVMFRNFYQLCKEEDFRKKSLARVLIEMQSLSSRIGYLLLYFLKVWSKEEGKREGQRSNTLNDLVALVYTDFCLQKEEELENCLLSDLKRCHEDSIAMFFFLIPEVYREFQSITIGSIDFLHLVVSTVDSLQLQNLVCHIMQNRLKMLREESLLHLITESLKWETFEQNCLWQLIYAHDFTINSFISILPKLQFHDHAEALTYILLMLKQEKPTPEILKFLLTRQADGEDLFVVAAMRYWFKEHHTILGEILATILSTRYSPNKRKRSNMKNVGDNCPSGEQILYHLDHLRLHCTSSAELQFYRSEKMQKALQQAQIACNDYLRKTYGDLFALAEMNEDDEIPTATLIDSIKKNTQGPNTLIKGLNKKATVGYKDKPSSRRMQIKDKITESSDQSSEDDEIVKPKQMKKRKKINPVGSDSD